MVILMIGFQILRFFVWHMEFAQGETSSIRFIQFCTAPSIDAWSMALRIELGGVVCCGKNGYRRCRRRGGG